MSNIDGRTATTSRALALRGEKSYSLIAEELGLTKGQVAGIFWRADGNKRVMHRERSGPGKFPHQRKRHLGMYPKRVNFYISQAMFNALTAAAKRDGMNVSAAFRAAIAKGTGRAL